MFVVLDQMLNPDSKVRHVQFGDAKDSNSRVGAIAQEEMRHRHAAALVRMMFRIATDDPRLAK